MKIKSILAVSFSLLTLSSNIFAVTGLHRNDAQCEIEAAEIVELANKNGYIILANGVKWLEWDHYPYSAYALDDNCFASFGWEPKSWPVGNWAQTFLKISK